MSGDVGDNQHRQNIQMLKFICTSLAAGCIFECNLLLKHENVTFFKQMNNN